jgi:hypothetical protein
MRSPALQHENGVKYAATMNPTRPERAGCPAAGLKCALRRGGDLVDHRRFQLDAHNLRAGNHVAYELAREPSVRLAIVQGHDDERAGGSVHTAIEMLEAGEPLDGRDDLLREALQLVMSGRIEAATGEAQIHGWPPSPSFPGASEQRGTASGPAGCSGLAPGVRRTPTPTTLALGRRPVMRAHTQFRRGCREREATGMGGMGARTHS